MEATFSKKKKKENEEEEIFIELCAIWNDTVDVSFIAVSFSLMQITGHGGLEGN